MSKPTRVLAAAAVAVTMTACVNQPVPVQATVTTTAAVAAPEIPDTPAGRQLRWLLDAASRTPIAESELAGHFAADFLKDIPADQINQVLSAYKGMRLERLAQSQDRALVAVVVAGGTSYEVPLFVDAAGLINGLQFRVPVPKSWAELDERLRKVAPQVGFMAAELGKGGACRPVHAAARGVARPLGSMFKLYVLGAVAERIRGGAFGWDTQLTITPELKSLPSGQLQDRPDGSKVSVLEAAKLMISISDNTATDLLIHKVGRKAVERTMRAWGGHDKRNMPFLTTRELFVLKGAGYPRHAKRYLSLGTAERRAYLDEVVAKVPLSGITPWTAPRELDTIEWYGSPAGLCEVYSRLAKLPDEHIGQVLSINDAGLRLDKGRWPSVWFKGGSEPGVLDMSFLARTSDGEKYFVTTMAINPSRPFDDTKAAQELLALTRGAFNLAKGR
ncbi:serine hydrolase [Nonomuraea sp. NPDC049400]|uniref:serine hydrolase n=1 Tax=Nonomuraea sp. NPDC049400 TaxID=3364352 RepID=UPI00378F1723